MPDDREYATNWRDAVSRRNGFMRRCRTLARHSTLSLLGTLKTSISESFLQCLYCHYVFDDQTDRFRKTLEALMQLGAFVDTDTCIAMLRGDRPIDGKYFHLSFDDGFRNLVVNAAPILKELDIPTIVFVPTALVGADWERTRRYCFEATGYTGVIEMPQWDELRGLPSCGMEIGSHTRTHARLSGIADLAELESEIRVSKDEIEKNLGAECKYFSWPYGTMKDINQASFSQIRGAGYEACFGAFRGSIESRRTDIYCIPRHHFEVQWPLSHMRYFLGGHKED